MTTQFDETLLQNLDDFIKYYEFTDVEKIYTNGSKLIQVSRIKQWFAYNNKQKELEEKNKTFEDYNKDLNNKLDKLNEEYITLEKDYGTSEIENDKLRKRISKAIEYIGNGNIGIPRKTREKFIKILKGE